jgi:glycine hydroxymethyltransferase
VRRVFDLIKEEEKRQAETLMMIPSENYTYPEVRRAVGSVLMQKYAEGQPHKRYYQGMEFIDEIELLCEQEALKTFSLSPEEWDVNVQALSGSPANLAVYNALLNPGDKIMSMFLPEGGHLSHGWQYGDKKVTLVSKIFKVDFYHVDSKTRVFNYEEIKKQAKKFKPKLIISGGTAYSREIDHPKMAEIAHSVGSYYMADIAHEAGLVAGRANKSPFPYADVVTMTTHKTLRGPRGALIFSRKKLSEKIDSSVFPGLQGGPHIHSIAGIAICLQRAQSAEFKKYAKQVVVNAQRLAQNLVNLGYDIVSGGTDKHLVLIDLRNKDLNGWFAALALEKAGVVVNRNTVPYDTASPFYPSGLRLGTPAITARGMREKEIDKISIWIDKILKHLGHREIPEEKEERKVYLDKFRAEVEKDVFLKKIAREVKTLCQKFPIP